MTPLKRPLFTTLIIIFSVGFIAILTWWLMFIVTNFRTLGTSVTAPQAVATPNQSGLDSLIGEKD
ncbi:MAG TPA: hypothetical protein VGE59_03790 [Patescibacteria group bacterium]